MNNIKFIPISALQCPVSSRSNDNEIVDNIDLYENRKIIGVCRLEPLEFDDNNSQNEYDICTIFNKIIRDSFNNYLSLDIRSLFSKALQFYQTIGKDFFVKLFEYCKDDSINKQSLERFEHSFINILNIISTNSEEEIFYKMVYKNKKILKLIIELDFLRLFQRTNNYFILNYETILKTIEKNNTNEKSNVKHKDNDKSLQIKTFIEFKIFQNKKIKYSTEQSSKDKEPASQSQSVQHNVSIQDETNFINKENANVLKCKLHCYLCNEIQKLSPKHESLIPNKSKNLENSIESIECCVCFKETRDRIVIDSCGHICGCKECLEQLKKCPICNKKIIKLIKYFISY